MSPFGERRTDRAHSDPAQAELARVNALSPADLAGEIMRGVRPARPQSAAATSPRTTSRRGCSVPTRAHRATHGRPAGGIGGVSRS